MRLDILLVNVPTAKVIAGARIEEAVEDMEVVVAKVEVEEIASVVEEQAILLSK